MSSSTPAPRELIARYHTLQKQLASLPYNTTFPSTAARQAQANLLKAQLAQISLPKYQQASLVGESQKTFDVTTWVLSNFQIGNRILDVGSIFHRFPNSTDGRPLDVTSIDLHSADESVMKIDFFEYSSDHLFDAVVLSLCVNFVGCPRQRGLMIKKAAKLLKTGAKLFLVLPAACVKNSRYCDDSVMEEVLDTCGLKAGNATIEGKLYMTIATKRDGQHSGQSKKVKRRLVRGGKERNNFVIVVDADGPDDGASKKTNNRKEKARLNVDRTLEAKPKGMAKAEMRRKSGKNKVAKSKNAIAKMTSNQRKRARRQAKRAQKMKTDLT